MAEREAETREQEPLSKDLRQIVEVLVQTSLSEMEKGRSVKEAAERVLKEGIPPGIELPEIGFVSSEEAKKVIAEVVPGLDDETREALADFVITAAQGAPTNPEDYHDKTAELQKASDFTHEQIRETRGPITHGGTLEVETPSEPKVSEEKVELPKEEPPLFRKELKILGIIPTRRREKYAGESKTINRRIYYGLAVLIFSYALTYERWPSFLQIGRLPRTVRKVRVPFTGGDAAWVARTDPEGDLCLGKVYDDSLYSAKVIFRDRGENKVLRWEVENWGFPRDESGKLDLSARMNPRQQAKARAWLAKIPEKYFKRNRLDRKSFVTELQERGYDENLSSDLADFIEDYISEQQAPKEESRVLPQKDLIRQKALEAVMKAKAARFSTKGFRSRKGPRYV